MPTLLFSTLACAFKDLLLPRPPSPDCANKQDLDRVKDSILKLKAELTYAQETTTALRAVKQRVTEQALQRTRDALQAQESVTKQQAESV